ncbi:MAG: hypothetical protein F6K19_05045 [Cyanothece sp. SIO1E1]|nr:hypothetical protein [Cyanothece sp. SIO1E1]
MKTRILKSIITIQFIAIAFLTYGVLLAHANIDFLANELADVIRFLEDADVSVVQL